MVVSSDGGRVVLFYKYFLPGAFVGDETLQFFRRHSAHYLNEMLKHQQALCEKHGGMKGRILISREGINGTLSCQDENDREYSLGVSASSSALTSKIETIHSGLLHLGDGEVRFA